MSDRNVYFHGDEILSNSINRPLKARSTVCTEPRLSLSLSRVLIVRTLLGSGEDGDDLVALALLGHRGQGLGAVVSG